MQRSSWEELVLVKGDSVTPISIPNGVFPSVGGINSQGSIVGWAHTEDFSSSFGFLRTKQGEVTSLTIPGALATMPMGINAHGVVAGSVVGEDRSRHGLIWDSTGPTLFDAPGADFTELSGINAPGTVIGNYMSGGTSRAFTLTGSRFSPLDLPDALSSFAGGINDPGQIVGYFQSAADQELWRGFIQYRGVVTPVDYVLSEEDAPPSFPPEPFDWGDLGSGTVTYVRASVFTGITGINDRGDIVGRAGVGYKPVVECGGCGLTADDFFALGLLDTFTGEPDGSRIVHVKNAGKHELQKILLPPGATARGVQTLIRSKK
jgi:uncharacterized membrane protein